MVYKWWRSKGANPKFGDVVNSYLVMLFSNASNVEEFLCLSHS
jgi:hypothetical protein